MGSWDVGIGKDLKDHRTMESLVWVELGWVGLVWGDRKGRRTME